MHMHMHMYYMCMNMCVCMFSGPAECNAMVRAEPLELSRAKRQGRTIKAISVNDAPCVVVCYSTAAQM